MTVVKSIELVVPQDVYTSGSNVDGQLVLVLHNTLIDPLVKVELIGRGYLEWYEEQNIDKDYSRPATCVNKADYVHRTKTFKIEGEKQRNQLSWNIPTKKRGGAIYRTCPP